MIKTKKTGRGGKRAGSGRPRSGKFSRHYFVTDKEHASMRKQLATLRKVAS